VIPNPAAAAHGGLSHVARLGREGRGRLRLPRRGHLVGRIGAQGHGDPGARRGREQLQALHGLQERHHVRRRDAGEQLPPRARAGRDADGARRERRARLPAAEGSGEDGDHGARGASVVAPARWSRARRRTAPSRSPR
jgi:hypothetical protein